MFAVYDNKKPARYPECFVDKSWNNNTFNTLEEAQAYAMNWLGDVYAPDKPSEIELNVPFYYAGLGDYILIKEI